MSRYTASHTAVTDRLYLFLSAFFGCIIAIGQRPTWQVPIESAQVLAGLVNYPAPDNPFYIYHMKSWSLLNQGAALLLKAGVSELVISQLIAGIVGAVSFVGIFLVTRSVSNNCRVALMLPLLMYSLSLVGASVAFPIALLGSDSTYGILGLSFVLLAVGLLGTGRFRTGAFLCGIAPAIHPALGTFCALTAVIAVLVNRHEVRPHLTPMTGWFFFGGVLTLTSFGWQYMHSSAVPSLDPALKREYLEAFIRHFDYHRTAGSWTQPGVIFGILLAVIAMLSRRRPQVTVETRLTFTAIFVSVAATLTLVFVTDTFQAAAPLKVLIPWRFINIANLCLLPICFGILSAGHQRTQRLRSLMFCSAVLSCLGMRMLKIEMVNALYGTILVLLLMVSIPKLPELPEKPFRLIIGFQRWLVLAVIILICWRQVLPGTAALVSRSTILPDRTNTHILRTASEQPGTLLTAGNMHLIQLLTRRPVVLDGAALDMLPYIPDSGPRYNDILRNIYGLDIFVKPPDAAHYRGMLTYYHRTLWEQRSREEWQKIRRDFAVTGILTPRAWMLQLPLIATDEDTNGKLAPFYRGQLPPDADAAPGLNLYAIP